MSENERSREIGKNVRPTFLCHHWFLTPNERTRREQQQQQQHKKIWKVLCISLAHFPPAKFYVLPVLTPLPLKIIWLLYVKMKVGKILSLLLLVKNYIRELRWIFFRDCFSTDIKGWRFCAYALKLAKATQEFIYKHEWNVDEKKC